MLTTILIWLGSGFAFTVGAVFGLLVFPFMHKKQRDKSLEVTIETLTALKERNLIGERQADMLEKISNRIDELTQVMDERL